MAPKRKGRRLVWLHRWAGIALAILLLTQAVTGLMLLHRGAVEDWSRTESQPVARADLAVAVERILIAAEPRTLERITFSHAADRAAAMRFIEADGALRIAYADPATGSIGADGSLWRDPAEAALLVHSSLTLGLGGFLVVAAEGLLLVFLAVTGVIVWWPAAGRLWASLRVRRHVGARLFVFDLHRTAGVAVALFLMLSGMTGALMILEPMLKPLVATVLPVRPEPSFAPPQSEASQWISRAEAMQRALDRFPTLELRQVRVLGADQRFVAAIFDAPPDGLGATHRLYVIDRDGARVVVDDAEGPEMPGDAAFEALLPLHSGAALAGAGRWLMTIVGIGLILLTVTGVAHFFMRRRRTA